MKRISTHDVRDWYLQARDLAEFTRTLGSDPADVDLDMPAHLQFAITRLAKERRGEVGQDAFDSVPFYSLCKGLFLPLSGLQPERVAHLFGITWAPTGESQPDLIKRFLTRPLGLSPMLKIAC